MNESSVINVNVDKEVKEQATNILKDLGLNMSTAINIFLKQVIKTEGIPFKISNRKEEREKRRELRELAKEIKDMERHPEKYPSYNSAEELFAALDAEEEL